MGSSGCASLSDHDEARYHAYLADPANPRVEDECSPGAAGLLSFVLPPLGFLYLGEPGQALFWTTLGLPLWVLAIPTFVAIHDGRVINKRNVSRRYQGPRQQQQAAPAAPVTVNVNVSK